jgi:putative lipoprotein
MRYVILALLVCLAFPSFAQETLVGSRWQAEEIGGAGVIDRAQSRLEVLENGRIAGNGGCNSFTGAGALRDGAVKLGALATTRMACPPAIMDQEQKFLAALGKAARYETTSSGGLILRDSRGATLMRFTRM